MWYNFLIHYAYNFKLKLIKNTRGYLDLDSEEFVDSIELKIKTKFFFCLDSESEWFSIVYLLYDLLLIMNQ